MKEIDISDSEAVMLVNGKNRLIVSVAIDGEGNRKAGFSVWSDRPIMIKPRADNSIQVIPQLMEKDKAGA